VLITVCMQQRLKLSNVRITRMDGMSFEENSENY
jgi:hypothetical protein